MYLQNGQLRMARIYTERAFDPRRPYDRGWKQYYLELEPWQEVVYAEVLHVAASLSYIYVDVSEACNSLEEAGKYVPFNEKQKSRHEAWEAHRDRLWERRVNQGKARDLQCEKNIQKAEGMENSGQIFPRFEVRTDIFIRSNDSGRMPPVEEGRSSPPQRTFHSGSVNIPDSAFQDRSDTSQVLYKF